MKEWIVRELPKGHLWYKFAHTETVGELIRCKDCKHYQVLWYDCEKGLCSEYEYDLRKWSANDFCSRAERKEECTKK